MASAILRRRYCIQLLLACFSLRSASEERCSEETISLYLEASGGTEEDDRYLASWYFKAYGENSVIKSGEIELAIDGRVSALPQICVEKGEYVLQLKRPLGSCEAIASTRCEVPTSRPTSFPSMLPTAYPSEAPITAQPTPKPQITSSPTLKPTKRPTRFPTPRPSHLPTLDPTTSIPSLLPTPSCYEPTIEIERGTCTSAGCSVFNFFQTPDQDSRCFLHSAMLSAAVSGDINAGDDTAVTLRVASEVNTLAEAAVLTACSGNEIGAHQPEGCLGTEYFDCPAMLNIDLLDLMPELFQVDTDSSSFVVEASGAAQIYDDCGDTEPAFRVEARVEFEICCEAPSTCPTIAPSLAPSTFIPSSSPTFMPLSKPTLAPQTATPSLCPTSTPSLLPNMAPTALPTSSAPTSLPTARPSFRPIPVPTLVPTTLVPSPLPTNVPSSLPTSSPSMIPTPLPTDPPTTTPTLFPSQAPTILPTALPSFEPTKVPSPPPTVLPSDRPTFSPSMHPTTIGPTSFAPSGLPSPQPSVPAPTSAPTLLPTILPSFMPTYEATINPTIATCFDYEQTQEGMCTSEACEITNRFTISGFDAAACIVSDVLLNIFISGDFNGDTEDGVLEEAKVSMDDVQYPASEHCLSSGECLNDQGESDYANFRIPQYDNCDPYKDIDATDLFSDGDLLVKVEGTLSVDSCRSFARGVLQANVCCYAPSTAPSPLPSARPTLNPTPLPTDGTRSPSHNPTTNAPTSKPTFSPSTAKPTSIPSSIPTISPTRGTLKPSPTPTVHPSPKPTSSNPPTRLPIPVPTPMPSREPSLSPSTAAPSSGCLDEFRLVVGGDGSAEFCALWSANIEEPLSRSPSKKKKKKNDSLGFPWIYFIWAFLCLLGLCICCFVLIPLLAALCERSEARLFPPDVHDPAIRDTRRDAQEKAHTAARTHEAPFIPIVAPVPTAVLPIDGRRRRRQPQHRTLQNGENDSSDDEPPNYKRKPIYEEPYAYYNPEAQLIDHRAAGGGGLGGTTIQLPPQYPYLQQQEREEDIPPLPPLPPQPRERRDPSQYQPMQF